MRTDLTIAGAWTQLVLRGLEQCGLDVRGLCLRSGLVYAELDDPDARVPRDASGLLWREAARVADDPSLGLHAAARCPVGVNNLLAHLVMSSPTLADGLRRAGAYQRVLAHGAVMTLEARGDVTVLRLSRVDGDLPVSRYEIEFMAGIIARFGAFVLPGAWRLTAVRFEHAAPPRGAHEHERLFGCPLAFGQSENALLVPSRVVRRRSPHHTPAVLRALEGEADALLERLASPTTSGEVRARLRARLRRGGCDVGTIAAELHLSVRTLQRRLDAEGTRFSTILDRTRRDLALELLDGGVTPERVAGCIGLSGGRALTRAMKRWTGTTPAAWRDPPKAPGHRARTGANLAELPPVATLPSDRPGAAPRNVVPAGTQPADPSACAGVGPGRSRSSPSSSSAAR